VNRTTLETLAKILEDGEGIQQGYQADRWSARANTFLLTALGPDEASHFTSLDDSVNWPESVAMKIGYLEGLVANAESAGVNPVVSGATQVVASDGRKVFIVHGHDEAAKESAARFLGRLGLEPIILHEQASGGRTIIEKFETYSGDVVFAVVLLTPDDVGSPASESSNLKKRARQNVIMELGYFIGRLGRTRVCALHKGDVELPSDYQGVLYIEMDPGGAWKAKLAQDCLARELANRR